MIQRSTYSFGIRPPMLVLAIFGVFVASATDAGVITIGGSAVVSPDRFEDFDIIPPAGFNNVSNEFAASGLTFSTLGGTGIAHTDNALCGNVGQGVTGGYLYMGLNAPCVGSPALDAVSIMFDEDVSELSWTGFSRAGTNGFTIEARLDGAVVSSLNFDVSNRFENQTVNFSGSTFDEIRFTENGNNELFFALDNLSWNTAAAVPEPTSIALWGIGLLSMAGVAYRRQKRVA